MTVSPYYEADGITLYHGDALEILDGIEFDVALLDPPYGINYRQTIASAQQFDAIIGDESSELAAELVRRIHPKPMIAFGINNYAGSLPCVGRWFVWDKRCNENADKMIGAPFELAWRNLPDPVAGKMFRVQHGGVVNADGGNVKRVHPTQKPVTLITRLLAELPPGVVLDPTAGSGSTLRAAKDMGRSAVGIEISEEYCEIAVGRLAQQVLDFGA